ncbi:MAG TPA: hypothetical protein PKW63_02795 [Vicinamibacterales bacterium]|nr:hypothetical protein [Vicinamibacterales bacterium]
MPVLLRLLAPLLNVAAIVFLTKRRRMIRTLKAAGADSAARAIPLEASGLSAWWLQRLTTSGVIHHTPAGLHWLDSAAHRRYRRVRIIRVAVVLVLAAIAWAAVNWTCCGPPL